LQSLGVGHHSESPDFYGPAEAGHHVVRPGWRRSSPADS
jgi:hypothetical protein